MNISHNFFALALAVFMFLPAAASNYAEAKRTLASIMFSSFASTNHDIEATATTRIASQIYIALTKFEQSSKDLLAHESALSRIRTIGDSQIITDIQLQRVIRQLKSFFATELKTLSPLSNPKLNASRSMRAASKPLTLNLGCLRPFLTCDAAETALNAPRHSGSLESSHKLRPRPLLAPLRIPHSSSSATLPVVVPTACSHPRTACSESEAHGCEPSTNDSRLATAHTKRQHAPADCTRRAPLKPLFSPLKCTASRAMTLEEALETLNDIANAPDATQAARIRQIYASAALASSVTWRETRGKKTTPDVFAPRRGTHTKRYSELHIQSLKNLKEMVANPAIDRDIQSCALAVLQAITETEATPITASHK